MESLERISLGVLLPAEAKATIAELQHNLKRKSASTELRWTDPGELFLSICSLGEVGSGALVRAKTVISELQGRLTPRMAVLDTLAGLPSALQPRTLHLESSDVANLAEVSQMCRSALAQALELPAERPDYPHIPIGILRRPEESARTAVGRLLRMFKEDISVSVPIQTISFLRHSAGPTGPQVGSIYDVELG